MQGMPIYVKGSSATQYSGLHHFGPPSKHPKILSLKNGLLAPKPPKAVFSTCSKAT